MQIIGGLTTSRPPKVKNHIMYMYLQIQYKIIQPCGSTWGMCFFVVYSISVIILWTSSSYCSCLVHAEVKSKEKLFFSL